LQVDVVKTDGSRGNHLNAGTIQQCLVAACAGTYDKAVGIVHIACRKGVAVEVHNLGVRLKYALDIWDCTINYNLHMLYVLFFSGKYMEKMKFSYLCMIKSEDNLIFKAL
jgi:hypothetical protein